MYIIYIVFKISSNVVLGFLDFDIAATQYVVLNYNLPHGRKRGAVEVAALGV